MAILDNQFYHHATPISSWCNLIGGTHLPHPIHLGPYSSPSSSCVDITHTLSIHLELNFVSAIIMLRTNAFILLAGLLLGVSPALGTGPVDPDTTRKRHDYRLSFKQPYFLYANESPLTIPYFDEFAGALVI